MSWDYRAKILEIIVSVFKENGNSPMWFSEICASVQDIQRRFSTSRKIVSVLNNKRVFEVVQRSGPRRWGGLYRMREEVYELSTDDIFAIAFRKNA